MTIKTKIKNFFKGLFEDQFTKKYNTKQEQVQTEANIVQPPFKRKRKRPAKKRKIVE